MYIGSAFSDWTEEKICNYLIEDWGAAPDNFDRFHILAAAGDLGEYEESAWFLLRDKETSELFEISGSHCSCYGFEGQFKPAPTTMNYLLSDKFYVYGLDEEDFQSWLKQQIN